MYCISTTFYPGINHLLYLFLINDSSSRFLIKGLDGHRFKKKKKRYLEKNISTPKSHWISNLNLGKYLKKRQKEYRASTEKLPLPSTSPFLVGERGGYLVLFCFTLGQLAHCTVTWEFFFPFSFQLLLDVS